MGEEKRHVLLGWSYIVKEKDGDSHDFYTTEKTGKVPKTSRLCHFRLRNLTGAAVSASWSENRGFHRGEDWVLDSGVWLRWSFLVFGAFRMAFSIPSP
ncbi:hypothetical protein AVEN_209944-1 [Araneus ventricosus]|uniref:Uncharacterized protein n=1 Tax=Araneus ventricosus TaxID=182803 RepID=A0A4Y2DB88_ARAVE|nr:hypothetical protein AVEN_209944-1 [Araneus ventricosus]